MRDVCPIWGTPASKQSFESAKDSSQHWVSGYYVKSDRAGGAYSIDKTAYQIVGACSFNEKIKSRLTSWLIDQRNFGITSPIINDEVLKSIEGRRYFSVFERAERFLQYISNKNSLLGYVFHFYPGVKMDTNEVNEQLVLLAITESVDEKELVYLLRFLHQAGFVENGSKTGEGRYDIIIAAKGHLHLADLKNKRVDSAQGFVAMWFDDAMREPYLNGIGKGISVAGYKAVRVDRLDHNNKIDDEIIAEIRRSRFVVADFTQGSSGTRGGVYYEAGFAHGLGIPVIFTCHKNSLPHVHFDTRQYNHIVWNTIEELCDLLSKRISATIGDGPLKINHK